MHLAAVLAGVFLGIFAQPDPALAFLPEEPFIDIGVAATAARGLRAQQRYPIDHRHALEHSLTPLRWVRALVHHTDEDCGRHCKKQQPDADIDPSVVAHFFFSYLAFSSRVGTCLPESASDASGRGLSGQCAIR